MSRKFKTFESRMSAESVARSDETYTRLKARMDLAQKNKGQAKACLYPTSSGSLTQVPQPFFPFRVRRCISSCSSNGTENSFSMRSRKTGPELYAQNGYTLPLGAA